MEGYSMNRPWHKRIPADMLRDYIELGWVYSHREGRNVVLVWPHNSAPGVLEKSPQRKGKAA
jgi:hypothetical protein